jgi:hypothetical protein
MTAPVGLLTVNVKMVSRTIKIYIKVIDSLWKGL